ncbi:MCP four helix bundle domain-containing protein [Flexithrix dorotheae]|uniref:MCP four helix bundle domain-containing protein n=1 Tax=Flexithrix dorotheae TaxID=70993 RepID=UPI0012FCD323|nr:MCP four helix bundle domain-containing protein [Flexithrix dorotheae]
MKLTIRQKILAIAVLTLIFLLLLVTNMMDNNHFKIVQNSLATVYEDRLVANDYIYKISRQLQLKKENQLSANITHEANDSIQSLIEKFATTKLTQKEAHYLDLFQKDLKQLNWLENQLYNHSSRSEEITLTEEVKNQFSKVIVDLNGLSEIQLVEGKRQISRSNRAIATSNLLSRLEVGSLVVILLIIQILILYRPREVYEA